MSSPAWRNPFEGLIDHLVSGPGEAFLLSLAGGDAAAADSAADGRTCPSFDGFPLDRYLAPGPILPYAAARGCYWRPLLLLSRKIAGRNVLAPACRASGGRPCAPFGPVSPRPDPPRGQRDKPGPMRALIASPPHAPWYGFARVTEELADFDFCRDLRRRAA